MVECWVSEKTVARAKTVVKSFLKFLVAGGRWPVAEVPGTLIDRGHDVRLLYAEHWFNQPLHAIQRSDRLAPA